jgi:hypothetical protein
VTRQRREPDTPKSPWIALHNALRGLRRQTAVIPERRGPERCCKCGSVSLSGEFLNQEGYVVLGWVADDFQFSPEDTDPNGACHYCLLAVRVTDRVYDVLHAYPGTHEQAIQECARQGHERRRNLGMTCESLLPSWVIRCNDCGDKQP